MPRRADIQKSNGVHEESHKKKDKSLDSEGVVKKKKKGSRIWKEIREQQKSTKPALRKAPIRRLIREIAEDIGNNGEKPLRFQGKALDILHFATEKVLGRIMDKSNFIRIAATKGRRTTFFPEDMVSAIRCDDQLSNRMFFKWLAERTGEIVKLDKNPTMSKEAGLDHRIDYWKQQEEKLQKKADVVRQKLSAMGPPQGKSITASKKTGKKIVSF